MNIMKDKLIEKFSLKLKSDEALRSDLVEAIKESGTTIRIASKYRRERFSFFEFTEDEYYISKNIGFLKKYNLAVQEKIKLCNKLDEIENKLEKLNLNYKS